MSSLLHLEDRSHPSRMMSIAQLPIEDPNSESKRARVEI